MGKKYLDLSGKGIFPRQGVVGWQRRSIAGSCTSSASSTECCAGNLFSDSPKEADVPLDYESPSDSLGARSSGSRQTEGLLGGVTLGGTLLLLPFAVPPCTWLWR